MPSADRLASCLRRPSLSAKAGPFARSCGVRSCLKSQETRAWVYSPRSSSLLPDRFGRLARVQDPPDVEVHEDLAVSERSVRRVRPRYFDHAAANARGSEPDRRKWSRRSLTRSWLATRISMRPRRSSFVSATRLIGFRNDRPPFHREPSSVRAADTARRSTSGNVRRAARMAQRLRGLSEAPGCHQRHRSASRSAATPRERQRGRERFVWAPAQT